MCPVLSITRIETQCLVKNFALAGKRDNIERCHCPHLLSTTRPPVPAAVTNLRARENSAADPDPAMQSLFSMLTIDAIVV